MSPTCHISGKKHISVGTCTFIGKNARIEAVTQYASMEYNPHIVIGDNVCINQNFHCTCAKFISIGTAHPLLPTVESLTSFILMRISM